MFDDIDETLRRLLIQEIPIRNNEVEIAFDQPKREWSARLNRPTLNIFLHDVRENVKLRNQLQRQSMDLSRREIEVRRPEVRVDLHYMITAWASEPDDEHRLLARTMLAFLRHAELSGEWLAPGLREQPRPLLLTVAQPDHPLNPTEIWGVLDNELRPALSCTVTLTLDPHAPIRIPLVRTRELRLSDLDVQSVRQQANGAGGAHTGAEAALFSRYWTIGGVVRLPEPLDSVHLFVVELDREVPIDADGRFVIGYLRDGEYTLRLEAPDRDPITRVIRVPADGYDIDVEES